MPRPVGKLNWSSDSLIAAGPEATKPTKVDPGAAISAQGFSPGLRIPTGFVNYALARVEAEGTYQEAIEVQNWTFGADVDNSTSGTDPISITWDRNTKKHYFAYNAKITSSALGRTWALETLPGAGPASFSFIASDDVGMVAGGGVYQGFLTWNGAAWVLAPTALVNNYLCAVPWHATGLRFVLGADLAAGTAPRIITLASNMTTTNVIVKAMPSAYTLGVISHVAAAGAYGKVATPGGLSRCVAVAGLDNTGASTGGLMSYYSDDGVTWTDNRITQITRQISDMWYDDARFKFYIIDVAQNLFSSADGVTWADTGTNIPIDAAKTNVLAQYGGIWVACLSSSRMGWSVDEGVTWHFIVDPFSDGPTGTQPFLPRHAVFLDDRFAILASPSADDNHAIAFGLRCR